MMNTTRILRAFQRTFEQAFKSQHLPARTWRTQPTARAYHIPTLRKHEPRTFTTIPSRRHQSTGDRTLTDRSQESLSTDSSTTDADSIALRKALSPAYQLWFTCKKCLERSGHTISKQAYHFGTCVINCPKCKSQHLISDNLKIFGDTNRTMEDIAKEYGHVLRKGRLGADGDVEFYADEAVERVLREGEKSAGSREELGGGKEGEGRPEEGKKVG